ncbi:lasso peptide biosynthesis PqqD family chaperone [Streptomyces sp. NPDC046261]|uniref:lasso peptide biosynthesis PqqD family chaperone n=1 Tax=Streptomyces sp. NPDC046261 TaxID=3157200 RepID=UPI0033E3EA06
MTVRLRDDVSLAETDDGGILLDQRSGHYWQLNHSASVALRKLLDGADEHEAALALTAGSSPDEVSVEQAVRDVRELTDQLTTAKLAVRT